MIEFHRIEGNDVVIVLDFGNRAIIAEAPALFASHRATTSSKTPVRVNRGIIYSAKAQIEACKHCGKLRRLFPGLHAAHWDNQNPPQLVDCAGRPCVRDGDGYHRLVEAPT